VESMWTTRSRQQPIGVWKASTEVAVAAIAVVMVEVEVVAAAPDPPCQAA